MIFPIEFQLRWICKSAFLLSTLLTVSYLRSQQLLSTYTGQGMAGFRGDEGLAKSAYINHPFGMEFDYNDNLYFCNNGNNVIRKIDAKTKIITSVIGAVNPGSDNTLVNSVVLSAPRGIAFDKQGYIYFKEGL